MSTWENKEQKKNIISSLINKQTKLTTSEVGIFLSTYPRSEVAGQPTRPKNQWTDGSLQADWGWWEHPGAARMWARRIQSS